MTKTNQIESSLNTFITSIHYYCVREYNTKKES